MFSCNSIAGYGIATKFYTWHNSCAVVPCENFYINHFITTWLTANRNFHQIGNTMENLCGTGPRTSGVRCRTCLGQFAWQWCCVSGTGYKFREKLPGPWFNIKMPSYQYRKSHCGDKTVVRSSYLHNGISYTGKTASLYWIGAQDPCH